ncbi:penicillin-binding transpeptidase domain-containing protein [Thermomicrobium sp.]
MVRRVIPVAAFLASLGVLAYGIVRTNDRTDPIWFALLLVATSFWVIALVPEIRRLARRRAQPILHIALVLTLGFSFVTVQILRAQLFDRERILARTSDPTSGVIDVRRYALERSVARGKILLSDGSVIAEDRLEDGRRVRRYRTSAAYLAGYYSPGLYGAAGLEARYDADLSGRTVSSWQAWLDGILHRRRSGNDIVLTIDPRLQQLGQSLLGDRTGGIVLLDADTGAVLALVTAPAFDPNLLSVPLGASADDVRRATSYLDRLREDGRGPLLLRPIQGLYVPGSTFKTLTAAAALQSGVATPDTVYRDDGALVIDSRVIIEQNRPDPARVSYTLREAYGYSLNVVYAQVGLALGASRLEESARAAGFGERIPFDLPVAVSRLTDSPDFLSAPAGLAETAFGQGQLLVTPLQMALVVAGVVRDGTLPEPYLVQEVRDAAGQVIWHREPRIWRRAFDQKTAKALHELMTWSVEHGYARAARIPEVTVGGKTGTAEVGGLAPHAWFIGFAERGDVRVVVAVVVEHGGSGAQVALPIGRTLLAAAVGME